jgi:cobalt/nickel transport system permease protein
MAAGHAHPLHLDRVTRVHALPAEVKIAATVAYTVAVVVTPREQIWAFAGYALLLVPVAALARVPPLWLAKRATIELPFVLLAVVLPFAGQGERITWLGMSLSVDGLYGAWNIFAKGTLGVLASLLLAATTTMRDLIVGLDRLRCPQIITQIATFMLRYLDVLADEARRMRVARLSRGYDPRFLWQVRAFAAGIGALFLRAFERGERVYLAMVSRGYTGRLPTPGRAAATVRQWLAAAAVPAAAGLIAAAAFLA